MRAAVITVSTSRAAGEAEDESGPAMAELVRSAGLDIPRPAIVPYALGVHAGGRPHWARPLTTDIEGGRPFGAPVHDWLPLCSQEGDNRTRLRLCPCGARPASSIRLFRALLQRDQAGGGPLPGRD